MLPEYSSEITSRNALETSRKELMETKPVTISRPLEFISKLLLASLKIDKAMTFCKQSLVVSQQTDPEIGENSKINIGEESEKSTRGKRGISCHRPN